jgi:transcription elongation factor GreA
MSDMEFVLTPRGYEDITNELNDLLAAKRPAVIERIRQARQLGDLSENFDYEDAKRTQAMVEARIAELKAILSHASIIERAATDGSVGIGSKVVVKDLEEGFEDEYTIVGTAESSPAEGKISHESCVGEALLGRRVGEMVTVRVPAGAVKYEIVAVQ